MFSSILVICGFFMLSDYNYVMFHMTVELIIVIVASMIFVITWYSRKFINNDYFLIIGIAFLFAGILDFIHLLTYKGMNILIGYGTNLPTQLWVAGRYLESLSFIFAAFMINRKLNGKTIFFGYSLITIFLLLSIFYWGIFPQCYIEGEGLTRFKIYSEYVIITLLGASMALLYANRKSFDDSMVKLMMLALFASIVGELFFTVYRGPYDIENFLGHIFRLISFGLIFNAIIVTALEKPYNIIFRDLKKSERDLKDAKAQAELYTDLMSHDINNVNQELIGYLELSLQSDKIGGEEREYVKRSLDSVKKSTLLIDNVNKIRKVKTSKHESIPVDLDAAVRDVISRYSHMQGNSVTINYTPVPGAMVMAGDLIMDAISNIVENSIKHNNGRVTIWIGVKKTKTSKKDCYEIAIEDDGRGIPDDTKDKIFNRSWRGETRAKGSGLGLYLVKTLVDSYNGKISVEDRIKGDHTKGVRFIIRLPAA
ncbi:hypothetical protein CUJ83_00910 [Methanocella sp. CWC-04]|uniref:histidine kinase n=1 Tax=Methanooceanicella nereidis TaxID=2052831 RepID=A0AAP2RAY3_9EURY|nr:MASE3 domain-containing protein [Methanocella sp. CWC-04]MCD1293556.1 hypothetical protein [Methanocella sp. CWC-04]